MEIIILRAFRYMPALVFTFLMFNSIVYFLGEGITWHEAGNLFQCKEYWWTPFLFVNDIIPYYVKDLRSCMRCTALFSIEMKLFLVLPFIVQLYHIGLKRTAVTICTTLIIFGFLLNGYLMNYFRINHSITNLLDFTFYDYALKPWFYMMSYYSGILLSFFYQEFKFIRLTATEQQKKERPYMMKVYNWIMKDFWSTIILFTTAIGAAGTFVFLHTFADRDNTLDETGTILMNQETVTLSFI